MKKIDVAMLTLGGSMLSSLYYASELFERYSAQGTEKQDQLHTVLVNNHGDYRYTTEVQNEYYVFWLTTAIVLTGAFMIAVAVIKWKK